MSETKILSREEIGEVKLFITAHRALAGNRVNDILYSHEALRAKIQRLTDLVRYQRMELHTANLISNDEYSELVQEPGSVARLHSYDEARAELQRLQTACDNKDVLLEMNVSIIRQRDAEIERLKPFEDLVQKAIQTIATLQAGYAEKVQECAELEREQDRQIKANAKLLAEGSDLRSRLEADQRALFVIDHITGDDFCEDLDCRNGISQDLTGDLKTAAEKISAIYMAAHSALRSASCHASHDAWRRDTEDKFAAMSATQEGKDAAV